jgi:hypothetical protein
MGVAEMYAPGWDQELRSSKTFSTGERLQGVSSMATHRKHGLAVMAVIILAVVSAGATSHVRIVRLSYQDGNVQMSRGTGQGLERAILNSPVVEGSSVVTGSDGLAEVEFENNSSVRLGGATDVNFRQLLINDAGEKVNEVELVRGTMYFDTRSSKDNVYRVIASDRTFNVQRNSQVRFIMNGDQVEVSVTNGEAQLQSNAELVKIKRNDTLTLDATTPAGFVLARGVDSLPLDRWNNERAAYQSAYSYNNTGYGSSSMAGYGYQDLAYYGGFMNVPGYGLAWQPYGAASWMGWNPYIAGAWAFTPGFGYAWASAYPWGWLPFHYGAWGFSPGIGWFWAPGSSMGNGGVVTNWQATAPVVKGPAGFVAPVPPTPPVAGSGSSVMVGRIGRTPAYIPGGPMPPNFASVIDHSSIIGMTTPTNGAMGAGGSASGARNSRTANLGASRPATATGSTFATPGTGSTGASFNHANSGMGANRSGHVFAAPAAPTRMSPGYSAPWAPDFAGSGASSQGFGTPMHSSGGVSHSTGSGGTGHSATGTHPK